MADHQDAQLMDGAALSRKILEGCRVPGGGVRRSSRTTAMPGSRARRT